MMVEWSVTPDYIINNWTDELLYLMILKRNDRLKSESGSGSDGKVSDTELFMRASNMIKVERN